MNVTTISKFRKNAKNYFDQVINDQDTLLITRNDGQTVVLIPLDTFNSYTETDYLLSNPANAKRLRRSVKDAKAGKVKERELIEI
jgi:antitoxin YefM